MLQQKIRMDMENAMRSRDQLRVDTLRMLITSITNEMKKGGRMLVEGLPDEEVITIIRREMKKREEAGAAFLQAGRSDQATKEADEYNILVAYTPPLMTEDEVRATVEKKKTDLGITEKKDAGILMGRVMKELSGKADGAVVKKVVDSLFA
jgi:uncharacterized protein YqeY